MRTVQVIPDSSQLQLMYTTAKINADRYNYTLKTKAIEIDDVSILKSINILNVATSTERVLLSHLTDKPLNKLKLNSVLPISTTPSGLAEPIDGFPSYIDMNGYMYMYNNLYINSDSLVSDLAYSLINISDHLSSTNIKYVTSYITRNKILETLMYFYTKCTSQDSLIPYMLYLLTQYSDYTLSDLIKNMHLYTHVAKDKYVKPELDMLRQYLPLNVSVNISRDESGDWTESGRQLSSDNIEYGRIGFYQTLVYGFELLYQYTTVTNTSYQENLNYLLSLHVPTTDNLITKYLYNIDTTSTMPIIQINPNLVKCFDADPNIRYENYKKYLNTICEDPQIKDVDVITKNTELYTVPLYFSKLINSMHHYAVQKYRINYLTFLYLLAKERHLLDTILETLSYSTSSTAGLPLPLEETISFTKEAEGFSLLPELQKAYDKMANMDNDIKDTLNSTIKLDAVESLKDQSNKYTYNINHITSSKGDLDAYYNIANSIKLITHNLSKQIKEIKVYNAGGKNAGLTVGKLDKKNLYKYKSDPKIFYNNNYKIKEMDLAFGCILDESGSMCGQKIINGKISMILLHEVLSSLGINHSIIGHTSDGFHNCEINKYFQFKEEKNYNVAKPYSLASIKSKWGNCDSGALQYMEKCLNKVTNKDKIVLIFSDGEPTECSDLELKQQVANMEANGIHVIGIGINFNRIAQYYPDNANGKNLTEMVNIIISILKRYVLEKED